MLHRLLHHSIQLFRCAVWYRLYIPELQLVYFCFTKVGVGSAVLELSEVLRFTESLNFYTYLVNLINGSAAFAVVAVWTVTRSGGRERWTKIRLASATLMLSTLLLTIACVIFTTYFDDLIQLKSNSGYFIADNAKMRVITEGVIKVPVLIARDYWDLPVLC